MVLALEIIDIFLKGLEITIKFVSTAVQARFSVANEREDEKALDRQLGRQQRRTRPLVGIRLNSDAAQEAVASLGQSLQRWRQQLSDHMAKSPGIIRATYKFFARMLSQPSKLVRLQQEVLTETQDCLKTMEGARPQSSVVGFRTPAYKNETVTPYAFTTLQQLLLSGSSKPPRILLLYGMPGTGKSTLSYLLAQDLEARGLFNGGVYRVAVTNAQQRQPLNEVAVQLQKNLLDNLGWPEGDIDATDPGQLQLRLNTVFKTYLRDRRNLIIIDGAPSWDLVEFFICNDMRGALLVTSETDLKPDAQEVGMGMDVDTQWANANVMAVQLAPCTPAREAAEELVRRVVVTPRPLTLVKETLLQQVLMGCDGNLMMAAYMAKALNDTMDTDAEWEHISSIATDARDGLHAYIALSVEAVRKSRKCAAATVFDLLGHVKADLPLAVPMVELLVSVFAPSIPAVHTGSLLHHLVHESLLYEVKFTGLRLFSAPRAVDNYLYASSPPAISESASIMCDGAMMQKLQLATLLLVYGRKAAHDWARAVLQLPSDGAGPAVITPLTLLDSGLLAEPVNDLGAISWRVGRMMAQAGQRSTAMHLFRRAQLYPPAAADKAQEHTERVTKSLAALAPAAGSN